MDVKKTQLIALNISVLSNVKHGQHYCNLYLEIVSQENQFPYL